MYAQDGANGALYNCLNGSWNLISAGGGGGTVTHTAGPLTATDLVIGNGTADITVAPDFTFATHTLTGDAAAILDMHLAATSGVLLPGGLATGVVSVTATTGAISSIATSGSGNVCLTASCVMTTPNLGTPSAGTLTNATGLPVSTGISGLGANVATFLATPSSVNLFSAMTTKTGTGGSLVFATSPALTTPNLGTPSTLVLTNAIGLPCTALPTFTGGDISSAGATCVLTVAAINGNTVPSGAAANQVPVGTAANTLAWETISDCNGSSNALNFTQSTHLFSCNNISTLSNPMTTLGDMIIGGTAGTVTRLAGPVSPNGLPYFLESVPAGGVAATQVWSVAGVPVDSQTGAGYTIVATDRAAYLSLSNASAQALTLPAISGNFASNLPFVTQNIGAGAWTITPTTQTINGNTADLLATKLAAFVYQDSTPNWFDIVFPTVQAFPNCQDSSGNHINWNSATRVFTCGTSSSGGTFYQTVESNASAVTQRPTLNLISGTNATVTCVDNAGSTRSDCTVSASASAGSRLDQITAATSGNTINSTTNAQVWNWALAGSTNGMTFGENTAAAGAGNIILDAQTLAASTASPFTATARGTANGVAMTSTGIFGQIGTGGFGIGTTAHGVVVSENATTAAVATAAGSSGQVFTSQGASADPRYIDFPAVYDVPAANCNNTAAGAGWSIGSGGTVTCRAGTNNKGGYITITDTSSTFATFQVAVPEDWDTGTNPYVRMQVASTDTTSGHTIIPSIQVACYKGDGSTTDDVAPNAAHSLSTITLNTTANQFWSSSNVQMNSTDMTGCTIGSLMQITVGRATDTATNAEFYSATVTFPRLISVQAN